jgi:CheY-like chemotaxis protein
MSTRKCQAVLYVDDDPDICEVVLTTLSLIAGLNVHIANSGERAIDLAYELRPDLILMDVMMPGIDGPTTLKRMRTSPLIADIPVIFMTAKVLPTEVAHFLELGAIGVIGKPFDPLTLGDELFALWRTADVAGAVTANLNNPAEVREHTKPLADTFLDRARCDVVSLRGLWERVGAGDRAATKEVERIAHSIHGTAAMFGFPKVSEAAALIERLAEAAIENPATLGPNAAALLEHLAEQTHRLAQEVDAAGEAPPGGGMFQTRSTGR